MSAIAMAAFERGGRGVKHVIAAVVLTINEFAQSRLRIPLSHMHMDVYGSRVPLTGVPGTGGLTQFDIARSNMTVCVSRIASATIVIP